MNTEDGNDFSYATLREFSTLGENILNIGTAGLTGCTVLTVVSSQAVYSVSRPLHTNVSLTDECGTRHTPGPFL